MSIKIKEEIEKLRTQRVVENTDSVVSVARIKNAIEQLYKNIELNNTAPIIEFNKNKPPSNFSNLIFPQERIRIVSTMINANNDKSETSIEIYKILERIEDTEFKITCYKDMAYYILTEISKDHFLTQNEINYIKYWFEQNKELIVNHNLRCIDICNIFGIKIKDNKIDFLNKCMYGRTEYFKYAIEPKSSSEIVELSLNKSNRYFDYESNCIAFNEVKENCEEMILERIPLQVSTLPEPYKLLLQKTTSKKSFI